MKHDSKSEPLPGTQAVVRAMSVLRQLSHTPEGMGLSELGDAMRLSKASMFRLLAALESEGMVVRDAATGVYRLGPELITLGAAALAATDLRAIARVELLALSAETGETATLEVLLGGEVLILDEVQGSSLLRSAPEMGMRWPAHATSTGKLLFALAHPRPALPRLTRQAPRTIVSAAQMARELARIERQGYAVAVDELEAGFVAMAAPVRSHTGEAIAALSLNGPGTRLRPQRVRDLVAPLCAAAERVSQKLGAAAAGAGGDVRVGSAQRRRAGGGGPSVTIAPGAA